MILAVHPVPPQPVFQRAFKPSDIRWFKRMLVLTASSLAIVILACFHDAAKPHKPE